MRRARIRLADRASAAAEGHRSFSDFVASFLAAEATRLEAKYNDGQRFGGGEQPLPPGRPFDAEGDCFLKPTTQSGSGDTFRCMGRMLMGMSALIVTMVLAGCGQSWPGQGDGPEGAEGGAPAAAFPQSLDQWRLNQAWTDTPRAFLGDEWTAVVGADRDRFPATMNGCDQQRFLVRWRAVNDTAEVEARWQQQDVVFGEPVVANEGWFDLDGCSAPEFRLRSTQDESTLTDVTVEVQQWVPAV